MSPIPSRSRRRPPPLRPWRPSPARARHLTPWPRSLRKIPPLSPPRAPAAALATKLQCLARLRRPAPPLPSNPRPQEGAGPSNVTASSANAAPGSNATYSVKDFLRAQVERHWYWDRRRLAAAGDWAVSIHLLLNRDGTVAKAEIVDDISHGGNPEYHDLALSARNAALLSP